jgi:molybdopterin molybdotransferase
MPEFLELLPPIKALEQLLENLDYRTAAETIMSADAVGRVTAAPVIAPHPLPSFPRSTVDGYAVRAVDTHGASESLPAYLALIGEIPMGAPAELAVGSGQCALIHTGGMLPQGANAVVMVEYTQSAREGEVEVLHALAAGDNVLKVGEDVSTGAVVIPEGVKLRPAEIGGLMAIGKTDVEVAKKPLVGIISSGDEVIAPEEDIGPGQVRDVNAYSLSALIEQAGGIPVRYGIAADSLATMYTTCLQAINENDIVVITAGSSASTRDLTADVINRLGEPGVLVHGVNVRPGKPTILGMCNGKTAIGLPGNPVSALVIASLFVVPVIHTLLGLVSKPLQAYISAALSINLSSQAGREDWVPVRVLDDKLVRYAEPVFGKSNLIFTLTRADGLVCIPADANGLAAGTLVDVFLF